MTMKFLPDVGILKKARNQTNFDITARVCKLQTKGMLASQNFAELPMLTSEINPEHFRSIFQKLAILQNNQ